VCTQPRSTSSGRRRVRLGLTGSHGAPAGLHVGADGEAGLHGTECGDSDPARLREHSPPDDSRDRSLHVLEAVSGKSPRTLPPLPSTDRRVQCKGQLCDMRVSGRAAGRACMCIVLCCAWEAYRNERQFPRSEHGGHCNGRALPVCMWMELAWLKMYCA